MPEREAPIRIAVAGANGKMGREAMAALLAQPRFEIVATLVRTPAALSDKPWTEYADAEQLLVQKHPDVWLDFTDADSVVGHIDQCVAFGVRPVVGATGYTTEDILRWDERLRASDLGGIAAPNFAIGALLMMRFASEAARFYERAEIVEYHHDGKKDAPSGTARRTAEQMAAQRTESATNERLAFDGVYERRVAAVEQPARGLFVKDIPIHSVRLPGLVAHQEVIFGGTGEVLTIRHDSLSRSSFMPGVVLACTRVMELRGMTYGLEHLLW